MIQHGFKIFFRNVWRYKSYTAINVVGLAIGLSCAMLIFLWIQDELRYDTFHKDADRIFQIHREITRNNGEVLISAGQNGLIAQALMDEIPEVEMAVTTSVNWQAPLQFRYEETLVQRTGVMADSLWFEMFSFPLIEGDPTQALDDPSSITLSESLATALFGSVAQAIGQTLTVLDFNQDFKVTGIFKDIPEHSTIQADYVIPFRFFANQQNWVHQWGNHAFYTYLKLHEGVEVAQASAKMEAIAHNKSEYSQYDIFLHPMKKWRL